MTRPKDALEIAAEEYVFEEIGHKLSNNDDSAGNAYAAFLAGARSQQAEIDGAREQRDKAEERYPRMAILIGQLESSLAICTKERDALTEQVKQLTAERDAHKRLNVTIVKTNGNLIAERDALKAERDTFRDGFQLADTEVKRLEKESDAYDQIRKQRDELLTLIRRCLGLAREHNDFDVLGFDPFWKAIGGVEGLALARDDAQGGG